MQESEILPRNRVFVAAAQEAQIAAVLQVFHAGGVAPEFFHITANGAGILHATVNHLFFAVTPDLKGNGGRNCRRRNGQKGNEEHEQKQDVALLAWFSACAGPPEHHDLSSSLSPGSAGCSAGCCSRHPRFRRRRE